VKLCASGMLNGESFSTGNFTYNCRTGSCPSVFPSTGTKVGSGYIYNCTSQNISCPSNYSFSSNPPTTTSPQIDPASYTCTPLPPPTPTPVPTAGPAQGSTGPSNLNGTNPNTLCNPQCPSPSPSPRQT
jgi:hypothetical protein